MRHRLAIAFLLLFVQLFPWAAPARSASSTLASYTWMADGAKYASARADGSGYVYKGALVFGRNAAGKLSLDAANRWRYSGKEEQKALNSALPLIDYGARMYDPVIARWMSVDPLAEKYYPMGGYGYCAGSPIILVDPDGSIIGSLYPPYPTGLYFLAFINNSDNHYIKQSSYAIAHPSRAMRVGLANNSVSWGISGNASNFEINLRKEAGFTAGKGSEGNAFRHTLWQAMITRDLGENAAIEIGNAHEDALPGDLNQRSFDSIETADQMTDLLNNEIGRSIGLKNTNASNKSFSEAILKEFKENGLWVSHQTDDKCFVIRRETLSQSKYEAALKVIGNKGENGLNIK